MTRRRLTGLLWALKWFAIVAALTFAVDMLYVFWPYPDGPRGVAPLKATVAREAALIEALSDDRSASVVPAIVAATYKVFFVWTGLDEMMIRFADPTALPESDEGMRQLFLANWAVLETAAYGLQLFSMRLGVLVLALPLFALAALGAAADGLVTWYRRRTSAGRESGFIYHRAKRSLALAVLAVWAAYLVPPVLLDPRWAVVPFVVTVGVFTRFAVAYFKKHL